MAAPRKPHKWLKIIAVTAAVAALAVVAVRHTNDPASTATTSGAPTSSATALLLAPSALDDNSPADDEVSGSELVTTAPTVATSTRIAALNTAPLIQSIMAFESAFSSERYDQTADDRVTTLTQCNCVTPGFLASYKALLQNTANPALDQHNRNIQRIVTASINTPDAIDLQNFAEGAGEAPDPANYHNRTLVYATYVTATSATDLPGVQYAANTHQLWLVWNDDTWQVDTLPSSAVR